MFKKDSTLTMAFRSHREILLRKIMLESFYLSLYQRVFQRLRGFVLCFSPSLQDNGDYFVFADV